MPPEKIKAGLKESLKAADYWGLSANSPLQALLEAGSLEGL